MKVRHVFRKQGNDCLYTIRRLAVLSVLAAACGLSGCDDSSNSSDEKKCDAAQKSNDSCTCGSDGQWACRCSGTAPNDSCSCDAEGRWACRCNGTAPNKTCSCDADGRWACQCQGKAPNDSCTCGSDGQWACGCSGTAPNESCTCGSDGQWSCRCNGSKAFDACVCASDGQWDCSSACTGTAPQEECVCGKNGQWDCSSAPRTCGNCLQGQVCDASDGTCIYTESPKLSVVAAETSVREGDSIAIVVSLTAEPPADVTLYLSKSGDGMDKVQIENSIVLPKEKWKEGVYLNVEALPDNEFGEDKNVAITVRTSSTSSVFTGLSGSATITVVDANVAEIFVEEPEALETTEDGGSIDFGLSLTSKPSANVTIPITLTENYATIEGADAQGKLEITFTPENWSEAQTVTVKGAEDGEALNNPAHTYLLQFGEAVSEDSHYAGITHDAIEITNLDNDSPNILTGKFEIKEGQDATLDVTLSPAPTVATTLTATASPSEHCTMVTSSATFTATETQKSFTVRALDDDVVDATHTCTITLNATSTDANSATSYNGMSKAVTATIADNDKVGITVTASHNDKLYAQNSPYCDGGYVAGCKSSVNLCYKLGSKPEAAVTLDITIPSDATSWIQADKTTLTIDPANYNKDTNCVTVTDIFDYSTENASDKTFAVTATPRSSDANYNDTKLAMSGNVVLADRAHGGIELSYGAMTLHEAGDINPRVAKLWIFMKPKGNAQYTVTSSDPTRMQVEPQYITFTSDKWWKFQYIVMRAVDNDVVNSNNKAYFTVEWTSNGKKYSQRSRDYTIIDDEKQEIYLTCDSTDLYPKTTSTSTEAGAYNGVDDKEVITCTVNISSPSESDLTITLVADNGYAVFSTKEVKFSAGDRTAKTFTLTVKDGYKEISNFADAGHLTKIRATNSVYTEAIVSVNVYSLFHYYTFRAEGEYTGRLPIGRYRVHVWGASGAPFGSSASPSSTKCANRSGYGAYASGTKRVTSAFDNSFTLMVGGAGTYETCNDCGGKYTSGGFNGGGHGRAGGTGRRGYGGGGATDFCYGIRCGVTLPENRLLVAGGGGGAGSNDCDYSSRGGNAGAAGEHAGGGSYAAHGETWMDGSVTHYYAEGGYIDGPNGTFGKGQSVAGNGDCTGGYRRGGGGGGWYGGLASCKETNGGKSLSDVGGGGGSSIIKLLEGISYKGGSKNMPDFYINNDRLVWYPNAHVGDGKAVIEVVGIE